VCGFLFCQTKHMSSLLVDVRKARVSAFPDIQIFIENVSSLLEILRLNVKRTNAYLACVHEFLNLDKSSFHRDAFPE